MPFQSTVRINQTTGIVGDIVLDGPLIGAPAILNSTSAANNVIGRAFRHLSAQRIWKSPQMVRVTSLASWSTPNTTPPPAPPQAAHSRLP